MTSRVARQRAREAHALLHAARELVDRRVGELLEADQRQLLERDPAAPPRHAAHAQPELDVAGHVEPGHQRVLLEDDAAVGARGR